MKRIAYSKSSLKVLRRLPTNEATRITAKIEQYASDPKSLANNVKTLTGSQFIRLRVADWRIIMDDQGNVLEVIKIGARGSIYE
ncbi:type II toxin-antitoxin system RelE/ParE family toxin [Agrobacterium sp. LR_9]|jgi:mRNA interferase RelE/StbE